MYKKAIPFAIALVALSTAAHAADIPSPAPSYDWTGFYVGAQGGGLFQGGDLNLVGSGDNPPDKAINPSLDSSSLFGGLLAGYNYQMGSAVRRTTGRTGKSICTRKPCVQRSAINSKDRRARKNSSPSHITAYGAFRLSELRVSLGNITRRIL